MGLEIYMKRQTAQSATRNVVPANSIATQAELDYRPTI
jgi:hypothetical protein